MTIIRKGVQVKKVGFQVEVEGGVKGQGEGEWRWWRGPGRSLGTGTLGQAHLDSL